MTTKTKTSGRGNLKLTRTLDRPIIQIGGPASGLMVKDADGNEFPLDIQVRVVDILGEDDEFMAETELQISAERIIPIIRPDAKRKTPKS